MANIFGSPKDRDLRFRSNRLVRVRYNRIIKISLNGTGSGQFAALLGVRLGIHPSEPMLRHAVKKGIPCVSGVAEALPFKDGRFDYILIVTTISFVDSPAAMLSECRRVLRPKGAIIIGFVNRNSALGKQYQARQSENIFYRHAVFYSCEELEGLLFDAGFADHRWVNTLSQDPKTMKDIEPLREGRDEGAFVVVRAVKSE